MVARGIYLYGLMISGGDGVGWATTPGASMGEDSTVMSLLNLFLVKESPGPIVLNEDSLRQFSKIADFDFNAVVSPEVGWRMCTNWNVVVL